MTPRALTREQVESFQAWHSNHLGKPLRIDGIVGPETRWAMDVASLCFARRELLRFAQKHIGLREQPPRSNDDPDGLIRGWLAHCNAKPGDPWCASFTSWCLSQVLSRPVRLAGALVLARSFPLVDDPIAGDLCCYPTDGAGHGHVFIVAGANASEVMGFEGNCDNEMRCTRRPRPRTPLFEFHRPILDTSGARPGGVPTVPLAPSATR
jgi:hypothetical protein